MGACCCSEEEPEFVDDGRFSSSLIVEKTGGVDETPPVIAESVVDTFTVESCTPVDDAQEKVITQSPEDPSKFIIKYKSGTVIIEILVAKRNISRI